LSADEQFDGWRADQAKPDCQKRGLIRQLGNMRVIPVIDLMNGQVVRAVAGKRSEYKPIQSQIAIDAQPATVARALLERFGFETVYVADLDAIQGRSPNVTAWEEIRRTGLSLWLDAGVGDPSACLALHERLRSRSIDANIIIALESLRDPDDESWLNVRALAQAFTFSLDLQNGIPIHQIDDWRDRSPLEIGRSAHARGFFDLIVLDLADVGTAHGPGTLPLCRQLIEELHPVRIVAGGGVRGLADLEALAEAGCDAALVASALHDGRLTPEDIRRIESRPN
jgi:phosphoribosylformimino-5-aminoimidazole carboxamide ribotide isomerase